jgi:hypothetical protein
MIDSALSTNSMTCDRATGKRWIEHIYTMTYYAIHVRDDQRFRSGGSTPAMADVRVNIMY